MKQRLRGLYAITDSELAQQRQLTVAVMVEAALRGGAQLIQYRDKSSATEQRRQIASQLKTCCTDYGALLIINDDIALARQIDADGVHLGQSDISLAAARRQLGPSKLIGVSCHGDLDLAQTALAEGADYIALGRFFPSHSKPHAPATEIETLRRARAMFDRPIVAIGGITPDNAATLIAAGADMIAAIHGLFSATDITQRARAYAGLFR